MNKLVFLARRTLLDFPPRPRHISLMVQIYDAFPSVSYLPFHATRDWILAIYFFFFSSSCHFRAAA